MTRTDPAERRSRWPALMKAATARAYLDGLFSAAAFAAEVAPHLERRQVRGRIAYTKKSLDAWIDGQRRPGELHTAAELARALEDDDDQDCRGQELRQ